MYNFDIKELVYFLEHEDEISLHIDNDFTNIDIKSYDEEIEQDTNYTLDLEQERQRVIVEILENRKLTKRDFVKNREKYQEKLF